MTKQVTKKQKNEVAAFDTSAWQDDSDVSAEDIVIPKIWAMQKMSKLVDEEKAKVGEFVSSMTGEILGSIDKPVQLIPLFHTKTWVITKNNEFVGIEPARSKNDKQWQEEDGTKNEFCLNFYCLVVGEALPHFVSFKSTSYKTGQKLLTQLAVANKALGKPYCGKVIELGGRKESNDKGTFVVLDYKVGRDISAEEFDQAVMWKNTLKGANVKEDHSDLSNKSTPYVDEDNLDF